MAARRGRASDLQLTNLTPELLLLTSRLLCLLFFAHSVIIPLLELFAQG